MSFSRQIAAQPGWFVLSVLHDETGLPVAADQAEIVAWAFEEGDELCIPYPVTMYGVQTDDQPVLKPSGVVDSVASESAPTVFAWIEDLQAEFRHNAVNR